MRLSDTEWTVMVSLWARDRASTAREVLEDVEAGTEWSYSTVRTLLGRLVEKGAVADARRGNQLEYRPLVSEGEARRSALRSLVDRAFGGRVTSLVQHLSEDAVLSEADRVELARMLRDAADEEQSA